MKVYFLITNPYIDIEPFSRICAHLKKSNIETVFCCYLKGMLLNESLEKYSVQVKNIPILGDNRIKKGFLQKVIQFIKFVVDRYLITNYFKREKPDLVIMGGDITDHYGRLSLDAFMLLNISVLLIPIVIPGPLFINPDPNKNIPFAAFIRHLLCFFGMEETVFFRGWILGSYHKTAHIAASNKQIEQLLINNGISACRITITGNPVYDKIHEITLIPYGELNNQISKSLSCSENCKKIVYCSSTSADIYGYDYFLDLLSRLSATFNELPPEFCVVIKLHPREHRDIFDLCQKVFNGIRYRIVRDVDLYKLLRVADLVIGHEESAVMTDAAVLGTTLLSLRLGYKDSMFMRFGSENEYLHITSKNDVKPKICKALYDEEYRDHQKNIIAQWINETGIVLDGRNTELIVDLIKRLCKTRGVE